MRLTAAAGVQWLLTLALGALLFIGLNPELDLGIGTTSLRDEEVFTAFLFLCLAASGYSWPAVMALLATRWYLQTYAGQVPLRQRWRGLAIGLLLFVGLPLLRMQPNWADASLGWALRASWPWVAAAGLVVPWSNRRYLRTAFLPV